jgi:fatty acid desaturase
LSTIKGHTKTGFFSVGYNDLTILRNVFNWWGALFFGVAPASFAFGHSFNHHKYNNGEYDVATTADKPRDSVINFIAYLSRWTLYSTNVSSIIQFCRERNFVIAFRMFMGSAYWLAWFYFWACRDLTFAVAYVGYPVLENILLLACINWAWHAFNDLDDPMNEYISSLTILNGPMNVLNEDYHVVHHQYPGGELCK